MSRACEARQESDEMACACGLRWDVNDPNPPACRRVRHAAPVPSSKRELLQSARKEYLMVSKIPAAGEIINVIPDALSDTTARAMAAAYEKARPHMTPEDCARRAYRVFLDLLP